MKLQIQISLLFCILGSVVFAQPNFPEDGPLYSSEGVARIDISIDPDTLAWLYEDENLESDIEFTAQFIFDNGEIRDTIDPVGFRLRGNTSRHSQKKSFKVSFNRFIQGGKYHGVEKLNLNGEHNDPSLLRAHVSWDIMRKLEIPAPRSNHVEVYINGSYYGLYLNVEHIDEEFVKSRFGKNDGNLYKCLYPADLDYLGSNPDAYKMDVGGRRVYDLKTNTALDDYSDLAHFIDVLNNTSTPDLECELDEVFNMYPYLKVIATDILIGNWDGPMYNKNNFYLYHNTITNKFEYIPYDLDNTSGIDWFGINWANRNIYKWSRTDEPRPIYTRFMEQAELRNQYSHIVKTLVSTTINFDSLDAALVQKRNELLPYVSNDPYYPLDYGFSTSDFLNSLHTAYGAHVKDGVSSFLFERSANMLNQVEHRDAKPIINYIKSGRIAANEVFVSAYITFKDYPGQAEVSYSINGTDWLKKPMYDDGWHGDGEAGDHIYGASIVNAGLSEGMEFRIEAADAINLLNSLPCKSIYIPGVGSSIPLYINEFMASNNQTIADEHGNYGDWIEIYNAGNDNIWLGNLYLTDNLDNPTKWLMPNHSMSPGSFLIIWADGKPEDGPYHANFKLSKEGEEIGLFRFDEQLIDDIVFGPQEEDVSYGREKDAYPGWQFFVHPTPGSSNAPDAVQLISESEAFIVYPNPAKGGQVYLNKILDVSVYNTYGQLIESIPETTVLNIDTYPKGLYIIVNKEGHKRKLLIQ